MSSLSYLGSRLAPICMVLAGCSASMGMTLASLSALKMLDVGGIPRLSGAMGNQRLRSLNSVMVTVVVASLMLLYSQSIACRTLAFTVMTLAGSGILSLR
jgi:hypothetical protein